MGVNFIFGSGHQNVVLLPHERPFRLLLRIRQILKNAVASQRGESSYESKILPPYLGDFLRGRYVSNTLLDGAMDAAERYFHFQDSTYKTDSNGYIICSPEKAKITSIDLRPLMRNAADK